MHEMHSSSAPPLRMQSSFFAPKRARAPLQSPVANPRFWQNSHTATALAWPRHKKEHPLDAIAQFVPLILIFAIMYFLLIRPQQKKLKEHQKMVEGLRRGDQVITQGGLIGKVTKVKDENEIEVELAEGVKVRVVQSTIASVINKTEPAAA
jgi:preprotein translocase subunit YajC